MEDSLCIIHFDNNQYPVYMSFALYDHQESMIPLVNHVSRLLNFKYSSPGSVVKCVLAFSSKVAPSSPTAKLTSEFRSRIVVSHTRTKVSHTFAYRQRQTRCLYDYRRYEYSRSRR